MKHFKRSLATSLALTMLVQSASPISAWAQSATEDSSIVSEEKQELRVLSEAAGASTTVAIEDGVTIDTSNFPSDGTAPDLANTNWTEVTDVSDLNITSGTYYLYLNGNVDLTDTLTIPENVTVHLCLNGYTLTGAGTGSVIRVEGATEENATAGTLYLYDSVGASTKTSQWSWETDSGTGIQTYTKKEETKEATDSEDTTTYDTLTGGIITGGTGAKTDDADTIGGGGILNNGSLYMYGGNITGNHVVGAGGGVRNNSNFNMYGGTIIGNSGDTQGGGVINIKGCTFNFIDGSIENNKTEGFGGGISNNGTFSMSGGDVIANEAATYAGGIANNYGGGLGQFTFSGGIISENSANTYGGGVNNSGRFTMSGGTIEKNLSKTSGGGVRNALDFSMEGGTISNNHANTTGGGVQNADTSNEFAKFNMSGGTISSNTADSSGDGIFQNGTLCLDGIVAISDTIHLPSKKVITLESSFDVANNKAISISMGSVGTVATDKTPFTSGASEDDNDKFTYSDFRNYEVVAVGVDSNELTLEKLGDWTNLNTSSDSANITSTGNYYLSSDLPLSSGLTIGDGSTAIEVTLDLEGHKLSTTTTGSVITVKENATLNIKDSASDTVSTWTVDNDGKYTQVAQQAATKTADIDLTGGIITGGTKSGIVNEGTLNMAGGIVVGNSSVGNGGGVLNKGNFTMSAGLIVGNIAGSESIPKNGGGVNNADGGTFNVYGGTIEQNTATSNGGGVQNAGTLTMTEGTIQNNTANKNGGGVYNDSTKDSFIMKGGTIQNNTATISGGGVLNNAAFIMEDGVIHGNEADEGGGIYNNKNGKLFVSGDSEISKNTAKENGGGVYNGNSTPLTELTTDNTNTAPFFISSGSISENVAKSGGGVYNAGFFVNSGATITVNKAETGGGVYNSSEFTMSGGEISQNSTSTNGGGVNNDTDATFTLSGGKITENTVINNVESSYTYGGGVRNAGTLEMYSGSITSNNADRGAGISNGNGTVEMYGGTISNNTAAETNLNETKVGNGVWQLGTFTLMNESSATDVAINVSDDVYISGNHPISLEKDFSFAEIDSKIFVSKADSETNRRVVIVEDGFEESYFEFFQAINSAYYVSEEDNGYLHLLERIDISQDGVISLAPNTAIYTGEAIEPEVLYTHGGTNVKLALDTDYEVSYSDIKGFPTDVGDYTLTITGIGDYTGTATTTFTIKPAESILTVTTNSESNTSTYGEEIVFTAKVSMEAVPQVPQSLYTAITNTVSFYLGELELGTEIVDEKGIATFTYDTTKKNLSIGDNEITAKYSGSDNLNAREATTNVTLEAKELALNWGKTEFTYNGKTQSPTYTLGDIESSDEVTVNVTLSSKTVEESEEIVESITEVAPIDVGTYTATAELSGSNVAFYKLDTATTNKEFKIVSKNFTDSAEFESIDKETHTGSAITPVVTVTDEGTTLTENTDYTVTYSNNTAVGTATVTITGIGNYEGTASTTFKITAAPVSVPEEPKITTNLSSDEVKYTTGSTSTPLTVKASASDSGTLSYQWYSNTTNSNTDGTAITSATSASYTPPTTTEGTTYYYVVVTNTLNGTTATATSQVAKITVESAIITPTTYTVSFNTDGGSAVESQTVTSGQTVTEPTAPTKTDYIFGGWYSDSAFTTEFSFDTKITSATTLYAKWTAEETISYTITLNSNGGTLTTTTLTTKEDGTVDSLPTPTRSGYTFGGWCLEDGTQVTTSTQFTADTSITAKWSLNTSTGGSSSSGSSGSSSSSSSSSNATYISYPLLNVGEQGTASVSPTKIENGKKGTVTVTAKTGYILKTITASDASGKSVALTTNSDGTYTFVQPDSKVTVTIVFSHANGDDIVVEEQVSPEENTPNVTTPSVTTPSTTTPDTSVIFPEDKFYDVNTSDWYYRGVKFTLENGLMSGVANDSFAPEGDMLRSMVVTVLYNMAEQPTLKENIQFDDVSSDQYYYLPSLWACQEGIMAGIGDNLFAPNMSVTKEQICMIFYKYALSQTNISTVHSTTADFNDVASVSPWAKNAVDWCASKGLIILREGGNMEPQSPATRAEIAGLLMVLSMMSE